MDFDPYYSVITRTEVVVVVVVVVVVKIWQQK